MSKFREQPLTMEECRTALKINRQNNRSANFRWTAAWIILGGLGLCYIRNKYGKSPVEKEQKKENEEKGEGS